jgi:dethiobiotin synthetase
MQSFFISGIGTGIGKTLVAAILTEALCADYWKPVQAGVEEETDSQWVARMISNSQSRVLPETYRLHMPASPHLAARAEGICVDLDAILTQYMNFSGLSEGRRNTGVPNKRPLLIEGAGGLLSPLNDQEFGIDLVRKLDIPLLLVSRNYLGSINHSLMTAKVCVMHGLNVAGWIFNDQFGGYEEQIEEWTHIPRIASIPFREKPDRQFVFEQAKRLSPVLQKLVNNVNQG